MTNSNKKSVETRALGFSKIPREDLPLLFNKRIVLSKKEYLWYSNNPLEWNKDILNEINLIE